VSEGFSGGLHEELAKYYRIYRGVPAPANPITVFFWDQIEAEERIEGVRG
jgi:hypothetical protein